MSRNFVTPQAVANVALYQLENKRVLTGLVNTDYGQEFAVLGDTINVPVRTTFDADEFSGTVRRQDIKETSKPVKLDRIADVSTYVTAKELTLNIRNFEDQVIAPAVVALNDKIDSDIAAFIYENAGKTIDESDATNLIDISKISNYFDNEKSPRNDRHLVLCPDHQYKYALKDNLSIVNYAGTSDTLREALLGKLYSLNTYMSHNVPYSKADTVGTATTYKVKDHADAGYVVLSSVDAATATVKAGDGFVVNGRAFYFTEDKTASDGNIAKIGINKKETGVTEATDAKVLTKRTSIAFHKDAVTFATRPLEPALGGAETATAIGENFSIRVTFDYDSDEKKNKISFDVLYGVSKLHDNLTATLVG